jgi:predicted O-linked N-acetylglucosamine transferase (SPINDLY family)
VGYLSSDLRLHSVAYFLESVFEHGNRQRFEIHAYHNSPAEDEVSDRLRRFVAGWTPCHGMTDEVLAERIRADRIDILVDLNGHTGGSRLPVLAYKPAPVQVSWLGYPTTTGLKAVDYRITDGHVDPPGSEASSVERLARLPRSYFCYRPPDPSPGLSSLPAERRGHVTFGSFNNLAKVTTETLRLWARVLAAVPRSHFYFKARATHDRWARQRIRTRFEAAGFDLARVELHGWSVEDHRHLELYGQLDISLDTFPYNGATTTCEALWMGVPVVTLAGSTHASRMGMSILKAAGEDHLIAYTADEFVEKAATLASRLPELAQWRQTARTKLRASALLDGPRFARGLETAFEAMWQAWLAEGAPAA